MILRLVLIVIIACLVFWLIKRGLPALRRGGAARILPFVMNPVALGILRRAAMFLLRLFFRR